MARPEDQPKGQPGGTEPQGFSLDASINRAIERLSKQPGGIFAMHARSEVPGPPEEPSAEKIAHWLDTERILNVPGYTVARLSGMTAREFRQQFDANRLLREQNRLLQQQIDMAPRGAGPSVAVPSHYTTLPTFRGKPTDYEG
jgi:hypothetical protein